MKKDLQSPDLGPSERFSSPIFFLSVHSFDEINLPSVVVDISHLNFYVVFTYGVFI